MCGLRSVIDGVGIALECHYSPPDAAERTAGPLLEDVSDSVRLWIGC